jgi:hypothetical protein
VVGGYLQRIRILQKVMRQAAGGIDEIVFIPVEDL